MVCCESTNECCQYPNELVCEDNVCIPEGTARCGFFDFECWWNKLLHKIFVDMVE